MALTREGKSNEGHNAREEQDNGRNEAIDDDDGIHQISLPPLGPGANTVNVFHMMLLQCHSDK